MPKQRDEAGCAAPAVAGDAPQQEALAGRWLDVAAGGQRCGGSPPAEQGGRAAAAGARIGERPTGPPPYEVPCSIICTALIAQSIPLGYV